MEENLNIEKKSKSKNILEILLFVIYGLIVCICIVYDIKLASDKVLPVDRMLTRIERSIACLTIFILQFIVYKQVKNNFGCYSLLCILEIVKFYFLAMVIANHLLGYGGFAFILVLLSIAIAALEIILLIIRIKENKKIKIHTQDENEKTQ